MRGKCVILMSLILSLLCVTAAVAEEKVVLYSAHNQDIIDAMIPLFEAATGIKAEGIKLGSGDVIARVKAEKDNPQCDVIWSIGGEQLESIPELLEAYTPKDWDKIDDVFKVGTNWLPYTGIIMVFVVNTDMLKEDEMPKRWTDLSDARFEELISSARADKSGSSYMQLATVLKYLR